MSAKDLTLEQAENLGKSVVNAADGNYLIGSFAAEMIGESYPLSKAMAAIVFDGLSMEDIGRRFASWMDEQEKENG